MSCGSLRSVLYSGRKSSWRYLCWRSLSGGIGKVICRRKLLEFLGTEHMGPFRLTVTIYYRLFMYIALYLQMGSFDFIENPNFRTALGQIETDAGLAKFLNVQTKCGCLEQALPSLKGG